MSIKIGLLLAASLGFRPGNGKENLKGMMTVDQCVKTLPSRVRCMQQGWSGSYRRRCSHASLSTLSRRLFRTRWRGLVEDLEIIVEKSTPLDLDDRGDIPQSLACLVMQLPHQEDDTVNVNNAGTCRMNVATPSCSSPFAPCR